MKLGTQFGNQWHAPANSKIALLSAYAGGASLLHFAVRVTKDGALVLAKDDEVEPLTGVPGRISELTLAELGEYNFAATFTPQNDVPGSFHYFNPEVVGRRFGIDRLDDMIGELPRDVEWLIEVSGGNTLNLLAALLQGRGALSRCILGFDSAQELASCRERLPSVRTALLLGDAPINHAGAIAPDLLVVGAERLWSMGAWSEQAEQLAVLANSGRFSLGIQLVAHDADNLEQLLHAAGGTPWIWGVSAQSTFDMHAMRPSYVHVGENFAGNTVDRSRFALGYAKANPYATVSWDDGIHIEIRPYSGPVPGGHTDPVERRLSRLEWDLINIGKEWPFYSGGGVGLTIGISDDFAAEVSYEVDVVGQATTLEMAVLNVDPGAHRGAPPQTMRDKDSFYDPHGAPPYVGVEHDEDDGFRINWNFGSEYDNNQYGRPVGDGKGLRAARLRLERRGSHFAAYYLGPRGANDHLTIPRDWVCVGVVKNDSMNPTVYLRCVGKRWRQENALDPSKYEPILANHFVFRDLLVECFPT